MQRTDVIQLDLCGRSSAASPPRSVVDQSLVLLRECLAAGDVDVHAELCGLIEECRIAFATDVDLNEISASAARCFDGCRKVIAQAQAQESDRSCEVASLIELVREAVATMARDVDALSGRTIQSAARFEALDRITNLRDMKAQLAIEVSALKQMASERQKASQAALAGFGRRIAALERQLVTSRREASLDPLTGIANRGTFDWTCREWTATGRFRFVISLLDVDQFKSINDAHGHAGGDHVLVAVAHALKTSVRPTDVVARFGGDEFALLLADLTLPQAERRLQTIASNLARASFELAPDRPFGLTVSCGLAEFSAGDTPESLVRRADEALYDAKRLGKNRVVSKSRPFHRELLEFARGNAGSVPRPTQSHTDDSTP